MEMKAKMQHGLAAFLLATCVGGAQVLADEPGMPQLQVLMPEAVFAPQGFDNNDNSQLVLYGLLPDSCFRLGPAEFVVDPVASQVRLKSQVYSYQSDWCLPIITPFTQTVDLGILPASSFEILVEDELGKNHKMGLLPVQASANAGPDDFLYGQVDDASFVPYGVGGGLLTIRGTLGGSCLAISEVKVFYHEAAKSIEVLPIAARLPQDECNRALPNFETQVEIRNAWNGSTLLHLRSQNGQSVNQVVQLDGLNG